MVLDPGWWDMLPKLKASPAGQIRYCPYDEGSNWTRITDTWEREVLRKKT